MFSNNNSNKPLLLQIIIIETFRRSRNISFEEVRCYCSRLYKNTWIISYTLLFKAHDIVTLVNCLTFYTVYS